MKKHTALALGVALLCSPVAAQVSSPAGFLTTEGSGLSPFFFGSYLTGRYMFLDGERRGQASALKEVAYRHDGRRFLSNEGAGRKWSSVSLDYAPCDMSKVTAFFAQIPSSTPTRVFSGSVTWPTILGAPPTKPAPWGGPRGELRFPFTSTIVNAGKDDMSFDYVFRGGSLSNGIPWNGIIPYFLDGYRSEPEAFADETHHGQGGSSNGCIDSGASVRVGAFSRVFSASYRSDHGNPVLRNTISLVFDSYRTAGSTALFHALGVRGISAGVVFPGVTCNKLYIDFRHPVALYPRTASAGGFARMDFGRIPYHPAFVGTELWFQPAWGDSGNGAVMLAQATQSSIVAFPPGPYLRKLVYNTDLTNPAGHGPWDHGALNPIVRYGR